MAPSPTPIDFLIAGVQKGGTTALFEHIKRDLKVSCARVKEAHFFDNETINWNEPDYSAYHALFDAPNGLPRGEATPIYLYWPQSLKRIAAYNPHIRLILIFRQPVERAWSHWRMERARGADDVPFSWAIRQGRERVRKNQEIPGYHRVYSYVERGFYGAQLTRALSIFPRSQILCLSSEELEGYPRRTLERVAGHIGVAGPKNSVDVLRANDGIYNSSSEMQYSDRRYLTSLYDLDLDIFTNLSGLEFGSSKR